MKKKLIFIFLDGVGFVKKSLNTNNFPYSLLKKLNNTNVQYNVWGVDANLNVEGIPQSGTGQVSLLCGINAAKSIGKHYGPFAHPEHFEIIKNENLFKELNCKNINSYFINAYPDKYFQLTQNGKYQGVFAKAFYLTFQKLNTYLNLLNKEAISGDITNLRWKKMGYDIEIINPTTGADIILKLLTTYDLVSYEYFFTDYIGHNRITGEDKENLLNDLETFILHLIKKIENSNNTTLLICSDHGNIEEITHKNHTHNPVFFLSAGYQKDFFITISTLYDTKNTIKQYFGVNNVKSQS
ncbi:MAG TPA: hypothetical protein PLI27_00675 [Ignavibacteriales bacterium]|nr:hypothetical protein [Ignavibacteriales bacterium]HPD66577.1 hypothetical protein [Ignavibacteriales bacterium]HRR18376.1 hypothetical protein [Ignavibacteriales bacterium]HRT99145.1 hypothetical protein [Ignavibacteriales bacterium]